ncbi:MFS transporter [Alicyclobacillus tolerans]|uniref:MFS transporter n=1 Tax=Alicyclobacillus tolerans TaxID=90970 RepID=UPI001F380C0C|nr:MFS transporter [Alicyclobacillus tolerans]MCF8563164.1 MFS transporter [Alicyclobacillus tolerans]
MPGEIRPGTVVMPANPTRVRWTGLTLVFILCTIAYVDRSNISVSTSTILKAIHITPVQMGLITTIFSAAYAVMQLPGAMYIRRLGTRAGVTWIIVLWSVFTVLTGLANGFIFMLLVRMLFGFGEAPLFPGMNTFNLHWFPVKERGFANAIPISGAYFAPIVAPPLTVWILLSLGWHWVFYLSGVLGLIGAVLWYVYTRDNPREHDGVNSAELAEIESGRDSPVAGAKIPWGRLFASRSFWGIGFTYFFSLYVIQFFLYWLPFFLQKQLHMSLKSMGFASSVPWIFIFIMTMFSGKISDGLLKRGRSLFVSRNVVIICGFALSAIMLYVSTLVTNPWAVVLLLSLALGFAGFTVTIPWAIATDIGGEFTGTISGWMNMWGFVAATVMPTVSAVIGTDYGWNYTVLTLMFAAILGVVVTFLIHPGQKIQASES